MTTLFLIFVVLVVFHFIVEGIIAPSERSKIRLQLFALRDEIRMTKIDYGNTFNNELYDHLEAHANKSIHLLHNYNIIGIWRAIRAETRDNELLRQVNERINRFYALLNDSAVPNLKTLHVKSLWNTFKGFLFNSLGWLPYFVVPILVVALVLLATSMIKRVKKRCRFMVTGLLEMPDRDFQQHFPNSPTGSA